MMKFAPVLIGLLMVPYGALVPQSPGNPNGDPYAGQEGSTYDAKANPPKTNGVVAYNPMAPLPTQSSAAAASAPVAAPAAATPAQPARAPRN
jgi:hypothetical protein